MCCVWLFTVVIRESENTKKKHARKKEMTFEKIVNNNKLHLDKNSCDKQIEKEKHSRN